MTNISTANPKVKSTGFTIVELMIATVVFSVVLLGALAGFIGIGHLFYKGVSTTNTQGLVNQMMQDVSGEFQAATSFTPVKAAGAQKYDYYCIGHTRYTYNIGHEVNTSDTPDHSSPPTGNYGLLKDTLPGSGCATPCAETAPTCPAGAVRFNDPTELLGDKMRLVQFSIGKDQPTNPASKLYSISIVVAYGEDDAFDNLTSPDTIACKGDSGIDQFCAVGRLTSSVYRGWGQGQ